MNTTQQLFNLSDMITLVTGSSQGLSSAHALRSNMSDDHRAGGAL